jgi:hypothetical protein
MSSEVLTGQIKQIHKLFLDTVNRDSSFINPLTQKKKINKDSCIRVSNNLILRDFRIPVIIFLIENFYTNVAGEIIIPENYQPCENRSIDMDMDLFDDPVGPKYPPGRSRWINLHKTSRMPTRQ